MACSYGRGKLLKPNEILMLEKFIKALAFSGAVGWRIVCVCKNAEKTAYGQYVRVGIRTYCRNSFVILVTVHQVIHLKISVALIATRSVCNNNYKYR